MSAKGRPYPDFHHLPIGDRAPRVVSGYIEVSKGSVNKYEYAVAYPGDYGFIPQTSAEDGDPLDIIVISNFTLNVNTMVDCRVVGMMQMTDESGGDAKILAVPDTDPRSSEIQDVDDLPQHVKKEIAHFFKTYKDLESGKWVEIREFLPRAAAVREVMICHQRYLAQNFYSFSIGPRVPDIVTAFVEVQKQSLNKYKWDNTTGILKLNRVLHSSISYPGDYGFIPETARESDGSALDILILSTFTLQPGTLVDARVLGVIDMVDEKGEDPKILAVVDLDPRMAEAADIGDVPAHRRREIEHFFSTYKSLEVAKHVTIRHWLDRAAAQRMIVDAHTRYRRLKYGEAQAGAGAGAPERGPADA